MARSGTRGAVIAALLVAVSLLPAAGRLAARDGDDPIEDAIDKIIQASPGSETSKKDGDPSKKDADTSKKKDDTPEPSKVETLPGGIKYETLTNGTQLFTRPDGTKQYVAKSGEKVTVRPDGNRVYEAPGQKPKYLPPKVNRPDSPAPVRVTPPPSDRTPPATDGAPPSTRHEPPGSMRRESAVPSHDPGQEPGNDVPRPQEPSDPTRRHVPPDSDFGRRPDPTESVGQHATDDPSDRSPKTGFNGRSPGDTPRYNPPAPGTEDKVLGSPRLTFGGGTVYSRESGLVQTRLPGGGVANMIPGLPPVLTDAQGKAIPLEKGADGIYRGQVGGTQVAIDPERGLTSFGAAGGAVVDVDLKGNAGTRSNEGAQEFSKDFASLAGNDAGSKYTVRQGPDGKMSAIDSQTGKVVGPVTREGNQLILLEPGGNRVRIPEVVDRRALGVNSSRPGGPNIFELERMALEQMRRNQPGVLQPSRTEQPAKDKPERSSDDDLDRARKLAQATLKKSNLEDEQKRAKQQLQSLKTSLAEEKRRVDADKSQLLLRQTRAENMKQKARLDIESVQMERGNLSILKTALNSEARDDAVQEEGSGPEGRGRCCGG